MTEIEAHKFSQEILDLLAPGVRAKLLQRLELGKLSMFDFIGLTVDGIPYDENESETEPSGFCLKFSAAETADIITKVLRVPIGEPSWTLSKYVGTLLTIGMDASLGPVDAAAEPSSIIEFPKG